MPRVLLIDHGSQLRQSMERSFDPAEIELCTIESIDDGLGRARETRPDCILLGPTRSHGHDLEFLRELREFEKHVPVIVLLSLWDPELIQRFGAFDYMVSPIDLDELKRRLKVAFQAAQDSNPGEVIDAVPPHRADGQESLVGRSLAIQNALRTVERVAHSDVPILVTGQVGTGKHVLARWVHCHSHRRDHWMVTLDCRGRSEELDRELFEGRSFGSEPGGGRLSRLEQAAGGTLYLQYLERLPMPLQTKLLAWFDLPDATAGATAFGNAKPRFLAAVTGSAEQAVADRVLREDLFNRLSAVRVDLPPLQQRSEDIIELTDYFLKKLARTAGQRPKSVSGIVARVLSAYPWPGNVRELEDVLRRASSYAAGDLIELGDLPAAVLSATGPSLMQAPTPPRHAPEPRPAEPLDVSALSRALFRWARNDPRYRLIPAMERELIIHAMAETGGNQAQAARLLGITRATLRKRLHRFNVQREVVIREAPLALPRSQRLK